MNRDEAVIIPKILSYEEAVFLEYKDKLTVYQDEIHELGIEMKSGIWRARGLYGARVEPYDLKTKNKLPHFYSSRIQGYAFINGNILTEQYKRTTALFPLLFPLVRIMKTRFRGQIKEIDYSEPPLEHFDISITLLLESIRNRIKR